MTIKGKSFCLTASYYTGGEGQWEYEHNKARRQRTMVFTSTPEKAENGRKKQSFATTSRIRKLTPVECERLQGLPDGYTEGIAKTYRYRCLGNAFNVDVVAHILSSLRREQQEHP